MMWFKDRQQRIMTLLHAHQRVSTDTLADEFGVSRETVRRDLLDLENQGQVERVHGGAVLTQPKQEEPFQHRKRLHMAEKKAIAKRAAALIEPGQCIMVDAGTTTSAFAHNLAMIPNILVITNSIDIATIIKHAEGTADVILLGGRIVSDVPATYGELTLSEIERFKADVAVLSPVGMHPTQGAMAYDIHEAEIARLMIARASRLIMLADHGKLGEASRVQYCRSSDIAVLVTGQKAGAEDLQSLKQNGVGDILQA